MKLLHVIPSLDSKYGGPVSGLKAMILPRLTHGVETEVVCLDSPDAAFLEGLPFAVYALGPSYGNYRYNRKLLPWLRANARGYDAVIVNGIWQYHSFATWRALGASNVPYFVYLHGMLGYWFRKTYPLKHAKKWLYWPWADYRVLRDAAAVLFTCEEERLQARRSFSLYRCAEKVPGYGSSDLPDDPSTLLDQFIHAHPRLRDRRFALFLGRMHPVKGCDIAIKAFAKAARLDPNLDLVIAGPDQEGMLLDLQNLARKLGIEHRVHWLGILSGAEKWGALVASECLLLPSHHENFGIVVAEALACGRPVLISNKVNIWREIEADGAGIVQDDTLEGTITALEQWLALTPDAKRQMQQAARRCFDARFRVDRFVENLLNIIQQSVVTTAASDLTQTGGND